jgi:hypothetical protein
VGLRFGLDVLEKRKISFPMPGMFTKKKHLSSRDQIFKIDNTLAVS